MSFPKAKLLRFNEEMTCAPPPGKYDPKFPDSKVIGAVIEKSKRFNDKKSDSCGSTESLDSICTRCTQHQHQQPPIFRTPQMPRRRNITTPRSAVETGNIKKTPNMPTKTKKKLNDIFNSNQIEEVAKRDHAYHVLGKDQEMASLVNEISELKGTLVKMENSNDVLMSNLRAEFETSFNTLNMELEQSKVELEKEKDIHQKNIVEFRSHIKILEENIKNCNSMNNNLEDQLAVKQNSLDEMTKKYNEIETDLKNAKETIEKMLTEHAAEIQALKKKCSEELEGLATAAELNLDILSRKMEDKLKIFENEVVFERKESHSNLLTRLDDIGDMAKERAKLFDSQILELLSKLNSMKDDLDRRANDFILSLNICSDMNEDKLKEQVKTVEELEAYKAVNIEQKIVIVELQEKVDLLEDDMFKLKKQCKKYEVIQSEATKTIQVLSQRLFESESEVEKQNEVRNEMKLRTNALEEKVRSLIHENNKLTSNLKDIHLSIVKEVKEVETVLLGKVECYKKKAAEETTKFRMAMEEKQKQIELLMQELEFYRMKSIETAEYISLCQTTINTYNEQIKDLSKKYSELEMRHNKELNSHKSKQSALNEKFENIQKELKIQKEKFLCEVESCLNEKEKLEKLYKEQSETVKNFEEIKNKLKIAEENVKSLEDKICSQEKHIEDLEIQLEDITAFADESSKESKILGIAKSELEKEIERLESGSNEKDLRIESLSSELTESKNYIQSVTEHFVALMSDLGEKERKCDSLLQEIEIKNVNMIQVSEEYESMKQLYLSEAQKSTELEKDMKEIQQDNEKYVDELISELVLEKERCTELSQQMEEIKSQNMTLEKRTSELEAQLKEQDKTEEELLNRIKILESNLEETKMENTDLNNEVEALYKEIEELEKQTEDLKKDKKKLLGVVNELEGEKGDLMEMIKQQQEEMELLTNEISRQQENIDELKQMRNEKIDEIEAQLQAEIQNELLMLQHCVEEKCKIINQMQAKDQDLVYKLKAAEADLIANETEKKNIQTKLKELTDKLSETTTKYSSMEKRKNDYKAYVSEMDKNLSSLNKKLAEVSEEKEKLKEQYNEEIMKVTSLTATIADIECRNRELESIIGPFKEQLVQYELERAELLAKASTTEKELRALELAQAKVLGHQNHRQKIRHVVHLTEQNTELKTEVEKLRTENMKLRVSAMEGQKDVNVKSRRKDKENTDISPTKAKICGKVSRQSSPALKERTNAH